MGLQLMQWLLPVWHHGQCQQCAAARLLCTKDLVANNSREKNSCPLTLINYACQDSKLSSC